jgi:hypothetical protein
MSTLLVENIRHEDASDIAIVLSSNGTLGIGTVGTARNDPLTVKGINNIAKFESSAAAVELRINTPTVDKVGLTTGTNDNFFINVGSGDRLYIKNNGNIGIGTDSPRNKLDVNLNTNRSFNVRVSNEGSVAGTGLASIDPVSGNLRDMVVEGEEVHLATGSSSGDTSNLRLSAYAAGGVKLHTNLEIEGGLEFVDGSGGYIDFGMDQRTGPVTGINGAYIWSGSGASGDWLAGSLVLQSRANQNRNIEFVTGSTPSKRLTVYGSGNTQVHNDLMIGTGTKFIGDPGSPYDIELQTSDARNGTFTKVLTIQSGDEFKFWGNGGADEIFRIDNTATHKSQTFGTHNAQGYYVNGNQTLPVVNVQRYHMGSGNSTTISSTQSYTNVGNSISYTPRAAGNLLVIEHGVQTWYGTTSNGSGDAYIRFLVDGAAVWQNERIVGNFDADSTRTHMYIRSQFLYTTTGTSAITIQAQGATSGNVPGGFNFYHTGDNSNQYIITEYEQ